MRFKQRIAIPLLLVFILLAACGGNQKEEQININDVVMTSAVGTIVAGYFETQTAMVTPTVPSCSSTSASTPSSSPVSTST